MFVLKLPLVIIMEYIPYIDHFNVIDFGYCWIKLLPEPGHFNWIKFNKIITWAKAWSTFLLLSDKSSNSTFLENNDFKVGELPRKWKYYPCESVQVKVPKKVKVSK